MTILRDTLTILAVMAAITILMNFGLGFLEIMGW